MATATAPLETVLQERVALNVDRVDRVQGIIKRVRILGQVSSNGRRYTPECLRAAAPLYEGARVNIDHPKPGEGASRPPKVRFGELRRVSVFEGALVGDLHYLKTHEMAGPVAEAAERMPGLFGLSHDASAKTRIDRDGTVVVEAITSVRSVDLVSDPATNSSLFEARPAPTAIPPAPATEDVTPISLQEAKDLVRRANAVGVTDPEAIQDLIDLPAERRDAYLRRFAKQAPASVREKAPAAPVRPSGQRPPLPIDHRNPRALAEFLRPER